MALVLYIVYVWIYFGYTIHMVSTIIYFVAVYIDGVEGTVP